MGFVLVIPVALRNFNLLIYIYTMKAHILMITWNRLEFTKTALWALLNQNYQDYKITVWDNGSADGTPEFLKKLADKYDKVEIMLKEKNCKLDHPVNEVFSKSDAEYIGKVDNDTLVPFDWLERIINSIESVNFGLSGVMSGFHFDEKDIVDLRLYDLDGGLRDFIWRKPHTGGCSFLMLKEVYDKFGPIEGGYDSLSSFTVWQHKLHRNGYINGYPYPFIKVENLQDYRSPWYNDDNGHTKQVRGFDSKDWTNMMIFKNKNGVNCNPYLDE